jgi:ATP-dependent helicase/nuclease subunit B
LDLDMTDETWAALEASHPQAGLARLLVDLDATRADVRILAGSTVQTAVPPTRFPLLSRSLLPASALNDWMDRKPVATDGLSRLHAADQQQEAQAIALVLRQALETPNARAALVTPDRDLAGRVAAALLRFGIVADDSAGEPLADTPPAVFLRLLVRAVAEELAPVPLLALLKHPLCAVGMSPIACREAARRLETLCLRGPRPMRGISGLRQIVDSEAGRFSPTAIFLVRLEACMEPALRFDSALRIAPADALAAVIDAAERMAATDETTGPVRLWAAEEGEALASHPAGLVRAQPQCLARTRRSRASAHLHLGSAGSPAAVGRSGRAGRLGRDGVAADGRTRAMAIATDAHQGRPARARASRWTGSA